MQARRRAGLGAALWALSCGSGAEGQAPAGSAAAVAAPSTVAGACAGRATLPELGEVPGDARLAVALDLDAPGLDAALARVEAWAREDAGGAPVVAGLALSQLGFQLGLVRGALAEVGFDPEGLLIVQAPGGELAWLFRQECDLEGVRPVIEARWRLRWRTSAQGAIAEAGPAGGSPYDLVALAGDRFALVPRGRGGAQLRWLSAPSAPALAGAAPRRELGAALAAMRPAPVRLVAVGAASGLAVVGDGLVRARDDGARLEIDDSLAAP